MPMTAAELAAHLKGEVVGDPKVAVRGVGSVAGARPGDLVYVDSDKWLAAALASPAAAILVGTGTVGQEKTLIRVAHPKYAFARAIELLEPEPRWVSGIHPTAVLHPSAQLGEKVAIGAHVVIGEQVRIGDNCQLGSGCLIGAFVEMGNDCVLFPGVTLYPHVRLGHRLRIHSGAVVGSDGFGYVLVEGCYHKFPQRGTVVLEDDVELGANTTIDRGALDETRIGRGTKLDNLVHVAHNVHIGEDCVIAAQTGISGSVTIGHRVVMGGQVGIADNVRIEDDVVIGAQAGIPSHKTIRRGQAVWGTPARLLTDFKRSYPFVARLPELAARLRALEEKVGGSTVGAGER